MWCSIAREVPSVHVGHGHAGSITLRSAACRASPTDKRKWAGEDRGKLDDTYADSVDPCGLARRQSALSVWGRHNRPASVSTRSKDMRSAHHINAKGDADEEI